MDSLRQKIIGGVFSLSASSAMVRIFSFLTVILITRFLSIRDYGAYILFLSVAGPFGALSGLGMDELITADVARFFGEKDFARGKRLLTEFCRTRLFLIVLLLVGSLLFRDFLVKRYSIAFEQFFIYFAFLVLAQYARNVIALLFTVHEKFNLIAKINFFDVLARFLTILIFIYVLGLNLQLMIIANIVALVLVSLFFAPKAISLYRLLPSYTGAKTNLLGSVLLGHGKWQIGINLISSLMDSVSYWLVRVILSTEAVAIVSLARSMFSALASLVPFKTIMLPIIARKSSDEFFRTHLIERITKYSLIFFGIIITIGLLLVKPVTTGFFPKYLEAIPVFSVLIFRLIFNPFSFSQVPLLYAQRRQKFLFVASLIDAALVLVLAPLLMRTFGIIGLVTEGLITLFIMTSIREWYIRRNFHTKSITIRKLFFFDEYDRLLLKEFMLTLKAKLFGI